MVTFSEDKGLYGQLFASTLSFYSFYGMEQGTDLWDFVFEAQENKCTP